MKLDPGIHIAMHSILSLKPGVTICYRFYYCYNEINLHNLFIYQYSLYTHITLIESMRCFGYHVYVCVWDM